MSEQTQARTLICFDYGTKRIGVAVGQELTGTASALETITTNNKKLDWAAIDRIINQWQPQAIVLGLPVNNDGSDHNMSKAVRKFSNQLQDRYVLPVYYTDERLSSVEAQMLVKKKNHSRHDRLRYEKGEIDKLAAMIILQSWLDSPK